MDRSIIDSLQRVLTRRDATPEDIRNDLWACLDLVSADDADALDLRFLLEKMELPAALDEFHRTLCQILARGASPMTQYRVDGRTSRNPHRSDLAAAAFGAGLPPR
jgi:hypothetical protein